MFFNQMEILLLVWYNNCKENLNFANSIALTRGEYINTNNDWRFCAVGNMKAHHTDENGKILYGLKAFSGGKSLRG